MGTKSYTKLTPQANALLKVLRSGGEMSRADIAAALGKKTLNPNDLLMLRRLEENGLIELGQRAVQVEFIYRVSEEK